MEYTLKRKIQEIREQIAGRKKMLDNINDLLNSDNLTCQIEGSYNMSFHTPNKHLSLNKELIKKILSEDKEKIEKDLLDLGKKLESQELQNF
jgi:hypothetical protein